MKHAAGLITVLTLLLSAAPAPGAAPAASPPTTNHWTAGGLTVDLTVEPVTRDETLHVLVAPRNPINFETRVSSVPSPEGLHAGETVRIRFALKDATGAPLNALSPGAWVDAQERGAPADESACTARIAAFVGGGTLAYPALNLNSYVVATLNDDASLSVLDPVGGFGGTRLLTMVPLPAPAEDWALTNDQTRLYASLPKAGEVAVIDTASWTIAQHIPVPGAERVALEPGEQRLWVLGEGLTAIDLSTGKPTPVAVGTGPRRLAFTADGRKAYVTNGGDGVGGSVSVLDTAALHEIKRLPLGHPPSALAVSPLARAAYVVSAADGTVTILDTERDTVGPVLTAEKGLGEIRFAPDGRFGFLLNPEQDLVHILDAAAQRIVQTGKVEREPDQVVFSDTIAYIRHRGSETVLMIPLGKIGEDGKPLPVGDVPGGRAAFGAGVPPSAADGLVRVPGMSALLIANPADRTVYFYKEGMAAPMGDLETRPRSPRAVLAVDRSLRERSPGIYETTAILPHAGLFDVAFYLPAPRLVHCFPLRVEPKPGTAPTVTRQVAVEPRFEGHLTAGAPATLRARLTDRATGQPISGVADLSVALVATGTNWSLHQTATPRADGVYEISFQVPAAGVYYVYFMSPSLGLSIQGKPALVLAAAKGNGLH